MKITESKYGKAFGEEAEAYERYRRGYPAELFDLLFSLVPKKPDILDIGCGTGKSTEPLVAKAGRVVGIDPDEKMLAVAMKNAKERDLNIEYKKADAEHIPFGDRMFDAAIAGKAFHWFANEAAFSEIKRVLKPKGIFFVFLTRDKEVSADNRVDPAILGKYPWHVEHAEARDQDHIKALFEDNGFEKVSTANVSHVEYFTLEERLGSDVISASAFIALSEKSKEKLLEEARADLLKKLGGRSRFAVEQVTRVVWGFN